MIDFTNCTRLPYKAYNGANGKKIAIEYEGEQYMLKFPPSGDSKPAKLSYINSCISEHIASSIFNMLGVKAQETMLGTFEISGKTKAVCACKDFTADGKQLFDFCFIKNTILDSNSNGNGTELLDILDTIKKQQLVAPDILVAHFWNMFVIDALLGNFDRHNGNWGFLHDPNTGKSSIAPVFNCESCLLPQANEKVMAAVLENVDMLNARVYQFPTSSIKQNGRKINYYDFLITQRDTDCCSAIKRICLHVAMEQIEAFIEGVPYITDLQKKFYKKYISARYELILQPAFELVTRA